MNLLEHVQLLFPDSSKTSLREWITRGRIAVDGTVVSDAKKEIEKDQKIELLGRKKYADEGIEILFEDREIVVVEKPPGLLSVKTDYDTLCVHAILKKRCNKVVFPVHRLDRETSGVLVFAYTPRARDFLKEKFESHDIEREYEAVVQGVPNPTEGTWESRLVEDRAYYVKSAPEGKLAITHYTILNSKKDFALLQIHLETGRKNQIRVHASEAGHPIKGDQKYGYRGPSAERLYLHARKLGFLHPLSKQKLSFTSTYKLKF